jgi:cyclic-di-GMP-binding protein
MGDHSFDVVSRVDLQEVRNAFGQAEREIATRYDLKRVGAKVELEGETIVVESSDEFTLDQTLDVLRSKLVKRGVHLKSLRPGKVEPASGGRVRQRVELQQGIPTETCKQLAAEVKKRKLKAQAAIQGDSVRISGKSKDELQTVITAFKSLDLDVPLTFTNYR